MHPLKTVFWCYAVLAAFIIASAMDARGDSLSGSVTIVNEPPAINSVRTYCSYTSHLVNDPCSNFSAYNRTVYVQVNVSDLNYVGEVNSSGAVKARIVFWNTTHESTFDGFGPNYQDAVFELTSGQYALHTFSHEMGLDDPRRTGLEAPPRYYRVKAEVYDGEYVVTSNLSSQQNADYTYYGIPGVVINEFMPSFDGSVGFIELYNPGDYDVNVTGWLLDDGNETGSSSPYSLTGVMSPGDVMLLYSNVSGIHLNVSGDDVRLIYEGYLLADSYTYYSGQEIGGDTYHDSGSPVSIGRLPDGADYWEIFTRPTPGKRNHRPGKPPSAKQTAVLTVDYTCIGEPAAATYEDGDGEPIGNAVVDVYYETRRIRTNRTDGTGRVFFTPAEAGRYTVEAFKSGYYTRYVRADIPACWATTSTTSTLSTSTTTLHSTTTLPVAASVERRGSTLPPAVGSSTTQALRVSTTSATTTTAEEERGAGGLSETATAVLVVTAPLLILSLAYAYGRRGMLLRLLKWRKR